MSWLGMEEQKPNTATACVNQLKQTYYSTKYAPEIKARFSCCLQHPAGKRGGHILILALSTACRNARIASALLAIAIPSVCLSVRLCHMRVLCQNDCM